jgi:ABC-type molybdenum transport system ATPase subunit/photorepair protein PhrA
LHPALGGRVRRFEFTKRNTIWEVKRRLGFVSPEFQANYRDAGTGWELIASGFFSSVGLTAKMARRQREQVDEVIDSLDLRLLSRKSVGGMSYGEFRRLLLARALVHRPEILIFDESFDGLDTQGKQVMARMLKAAANRGASLIVVSHHAEDLPQCLTHAVRFNAGRIVEQGPVSGREVSLIQRG